MAPSNYDPTITEIASRVREMRSICGFTMEEMAEKTGITVEEYAAYEQGKEDFPFSFLLKASIAFGIDTVDLIEGRSARLSTYMVTRGGRGQVTVDEDGIEIRNLAPLFRNKIAEPHWVRYAYSEDQQGKPIHTDTHSGQEFDYIVSGKLKVQIGEHTEVLGPGDSIYYNSSEPHGMIAVEGGDCVFVAVVLPGENVETEEVSKSIVTARRNVKLLCSEFIRCVENPDGSLKHVEFKNTERFNFAFDCVDALAEAYPDKLAMIHISRDHTERRFTFDDMRRQSNATANYFKALGIKKGDRVMVVLKRHYQFWFTMLALHKIGAIAIPASNQLMQHDYEYRFNQAQITAIVATADGIVPEQIDLAAANCPVLELKVLVNGTRSGWHSFNDEYSLYSQEFSRTADTPCGDDISLMFFTSGTTGHPKSAAHSYKYALGHFVTAKYWHCVERDGLHLTISDTGWGKALWGKLYGQWLSEGAVFVYDFDRFVADDIMPMFKRYNITTFCAPPTMLRMFIKEDLSKYDLSSLHHITTAGEALNPEVFRQFEKATGLQIMEGFGQTETTLTIGNLVGTTPRLGSMGKASPQFDMDVVDAEGNPVPVGETGEIVVRVQEGSELPCGLFKGYYNDEQKTAECWHDGLYHTGDTAWKDEDGYFWFVGRVDDVIKSSGYRIGPFEIENVIMELPYVLECGVSAAPDEIRGQVVKASIVLVKGTEGTEELKKEIQNYVKSHTAPYKYPRIVVFRDSLPKTTSGKIQRNKL
ncbi:MAG: AMP-binding protein [Oscillospiraceae bacterium]|nr:AMP-binding protein [Oscillospiraceae bacterium]